MWRWWRRREHGRNRHIHARICWPLSLSFGYMVSPLGSSPMWDVVMTPVVKKRKLQSQHTPNGNSSFCRRNVWKRKNEEEEEEGKGRGGVRKY